MISPNELRILCQIIRKSTRVNNDSVDPQMNMTDASLENTAKNDKYHTHLTLVYLSSFETVTLSHSN